jgi:hypothetical protein
MLATIAKRFVHCPLACTALMLSGCNPGNDVDSTPAVSTTLKASPATVERGGTTQLTWSSAGAASCIASGAWSGNQPTSGSAQSSPLDDASNIFSLSCAGRDGSARSSIVVGARDGRQSGLDFPGSAATAGTVRFRFTKPLDIYPATYIWRVNLRSEAQYYTTFFWGNDGEFRWDEHGFPNSYYGAHPYPSPAPHFVAPQDVGPRYWEIAVAGLDVLSKQQVEYGRWHTQALRVWSDFLGKHHEFYWDLPDTNKVIRQRQPRSYGNKLPPRPALTWGDAPWNPSNEIMNGVIRGIQIYSTALSKDDLLAEAATPLSTAAGASHVWYVNLDPTPTDISDKSGAGHQPEWVGPERPQLWISPAS